MSHPPLLGRTPSSISTTSPKPGTSVSQNFYVAGSFTIVEGEPTDYTISCTLQLNGAVQPVQIVIVVDYPNQTWFALIPAPAIGSGYSVVCNLNLNGESQADTSIAGLTLLAATDCSVSITNPALPNPTVKTSFTGTGAYSGGDLVGGGLYDSSGSFVQDPSTGVAGNNQWSNQYLNVAKGTGYALVATLWSNATQQIVAGYMLSNLTVN